MSAKDIHNAKIIEEAMRMLGLSFGMKTNPQIIRSVLKEMKLTDFKSNIISVEKIFSEMQTKPKSFKPLFVDIKNGIAEKHPAIIEFLELALEKQWLNASDYIIRSAHTTFILEFITSTMCNSDEFFVEMHNHIKKKEMKCGIDSSHLLKAFINVFRLSHSFFGSIKTLTIDPMMIHLNPTFRNFKLNKQELTKLYKDSKLNYFEYRLLSQKNKMLSFINLGRINIYEAGISEYKLGFESNSICAHVLSEDLQKNKPLPKFKSMHLCPADSTNTFYKQLENNSCLYFPVSEKWQSLYVTWNMAFILSNLDNLDILFPKLLIPSVIDVKSNKFIEPRVVSLWLSINSVIFRMKAGLNVHGPKNRDEMAQAWGNINKKYAFDLAKRETHENSKTLKKSFKRMFSHPYYNLFNLARMFF